MLGKGGVYPLKKFARIVNINLVGTFNVLRLAAERIAKTEPIGGPDTLERGVIINTASVAAFDGQIGQAAYSASKGGVVGMTCRSRATWRTRPFGWSPSHRGSSTPAAGRAARTGEAVARCAGSAPSRLGKPSEYGALAAHIVENPMLNGEVIRLDGAIRMAPR